MHKTLSHAPPAPLPTSAPSAQVGVANFSGDGLQKLCRVKLFSPGFWISLGGVAVGKSQKKLKNLLAMA